MKLLTETRVCCGLEGPQFKPECLLRVSDGAYTFHHKGSTLNLIHYHIGLPVGKPWLHAAYPFLSSY